jgi:hypothetical protein
MSQEKRPTPSNPTAPSVVVGKYDPRQVVTVTGPASPPATGEAAAPMPAASVPRPDGAEAAAASRPARPVEIGGPTGPEPTRYGDWERNGRASDF